MKVYIKEPKTTLNHWFLSPIKIKHDVVEMGMSYTDCNVKSASEHAKVMKAWYEAWQQED